MTGAQASSAGLYAWLSELIVSLSFVVHPLEAAAQEKRRAEEEEAARNPSEAWFWTRWWAGSAAAPSPASQDVSDAADDAAASSWTAWIPFWRTATGDSAPADSVPAGSTPAESGSSDQDARASPSASQTQDSPPPPSPSPQDQPRPRVPTDSDLSLYIHAAPIGPAFARAVAAELVQEGSAWDALPVDAGDDVLAAFQIAKREAQRRLVSAVRRGREALVPGAEAPAGDVKGLGDAAAPGPRPAALAQALAVLCSLAADEQRRAWLLRMGVLPMLWQLNERLSAPEADEVEGGEEGEAGSGDGMPTGSAGSEAPLSAPPDHLVPPGQSSAFPARARPSSAPQPATNEEGAALALLETARQTARLLALLSSDVRGAKALMRERLPRSGWIAWLQAAATEDDCQLSSNAVKALLHLESASATLPAAAGEGLAGEARKIAAAVASVIDWHRRAFEGGAAREEGDEAGGLLASPVSDSSPIPPAALLPGPAQERLARREAAVAGGEAPWSAPALAVEVLETVRAALESSARRPLPLARRLILRDGVHLFVPGDPHHEVLARCGRDCAAAPAPAIDVVFVHGIRGGPFATWRQEGQPRPGRGRPLLHHACWPAAWLSRDLPGARLLSIEYAATASGWAGEALPFRETVAQLAGVLLDAGVGARPVGFVCHSMGGVIVKELLAEAEAQAARGAAPRDGRDWRVFARRTRGLVSFAVPHSGSRLADWGWRLRYVGGAPAGAVQHLKTTERHLEDVNAVVRGMFKRGALDVLSFGEGMPMRVAYLKTLVVPLESSYPGYGEFHVLPSHDHISACKPADRNDVTYARTLEFLKRCVAAAERERADERARSDDAAAAVL